MTFEGWLAVCLSVRVLLLFLQLVTAEISQLKKLLLSRKHASIYISSRSLYYIGQRTQIRAKPLPTYIYLYFYVGMEENAFWPSSSSLLYVSDSMRITLGNGPQPGLYQLAKTSAAAIAHILQYIAYYYYMRGSFLSLQLYVPVYTKLDLQLRRLQLAWQNERTW